MTTLRALKRLVLGETWLLPLGLVALFAAADAVIRPLLGSSWPALGGFVLLTGVVGLLLVSVGRTASRR